MRLIVVKRSPYATMRHRWLFAFWTTRRPIISPVCVRVRQGYDHATAALGVYVDVAVIWKTFPEIQEACMCCMCMTTGSYQCCKDSSYMRGDTD